VLDGVRGVAVMLVILYHSTHEWPAGSGVAKAIGKIFANGWSGVELFFVLSGYLITSILLKTRDRPGYYRRFFIARFCRIFPLYYVTLAAVFVVLPAFVPRFEHSALYHRQGWLWSYMTNFGLVHADQFIFGSQDLHLDHFWSLAVEEQFYLVWPVVVAVLGRRVRWAAIGMIILGILLRLSGEYTVFALHFSILTRWDGLAAGVFLATVLPLGQRPTTHIGSAGALAAICLISAELVTRAGWTQAYRAVEFTLFAAGYAAGMYFILGRPTGTVGRLLTASALSSLGKYSYALYIVHPLFLPHCRRMALLIAGESITGLLCFIGLLMIACLATARLSYAAIESPSMQLRDLLLHRSRPAITIGMHGTRIT